MPSCTCLAMVEGSGGTSGAHTVILEACTALLRGASPVPQEDLPCTDSECRWVGVTV